MRLDLVRHETERSCKAIAGPLVGRASKARQDGRLYLLSRQECLGQNWPFNAPEREILELNWTLVPQQQPENEDYQHNTANPPANHRATVIVAATTAKNKQQDQDEQNEIHNRPPMDVNDR
jgi:hypothetical protein